MGAGELRERLAFERRAVLDDGYGNTVSGDWETVLTVAARVQPMRGSESVLAARLEGVQPVRIVIRYSAASAAITTDWRARDVRSGQIYALRTVANMDERRAYIEMMAQEGVAA